MKQTFNFLDSLCIAQPSIKSSKDDAIGLLNKNRSTTLRVQIDATHSGVLTNMRVYPGKKVMTGYTSYFSKERGGSADYDKPVLRHHDSHSDAIGRVTNAKYTQLKFGDEFEMDYLSPSKVGDKGSGVVTVDAIITDPDAIKKILDGRYLSVSAGHHTDAALCSICGENILGCEHMPGRSYNSEGEASSEDDANLCYVITNNMTYDEISFVNMPAQPPAKLTNFNWADCKDMRDKENILIESMVVSSKEAVRTLTLTDSDDELNLLTGRRKSDSKKIIVAVKPATADKLKAALSLPNAGDDDLNIHPKDNGNKVEQPEQNLKAEDQKAQKEGNKMDLTELQTKLAGLEKSLSDAMTKITQLEEQVKARDTEITKLQGESKNMDSRMREVLATSLTSLKIRLKKPDASGLDSKEKIAEHVKKLSTRAATSLEDSVSDLMVELEHTKEADIKTATTEGAGKLLADKLKVEDPTAKKGTTPTQDKSKSKESTNASSVLDRVLGL